MSMNGSVVAVKLKDKVTLYVRNGTSWTKSDSASTPREIQINSDGSLAAFLFSDKTELYVRTKNNVWIPSTIPGYAHTLHISDNGEIVTMALNGNVVLSARVGDMITPTFTEPAVSSLISGDGLLVVMKLEHSLELYATPGALGDIALKNITTEQLDFIYALNVAYKQHAPLPVILDTQAQEQFDLLFKDAPAMQQFLRKNYKIMSLNAHVEKLYKTVEPALTAAEKKEYAAYTRAEDKRAWLQKKLAERKEASSMWSTPEKIKKAKIKAEKKGIPFAQWIAQEKNKK